MLRTLALFPIAFVLIVAACGGDDDDGATPFPTGGAGSATETALPDGDDDDGETPLDEKTPGPDETSNDNQTPAPTAPGEVPTAPPTASEGTPAIAPASEAEFIAQFAGLDVQIETCAYNPATALTNCPGSGLYAIDPPIVGQDTQCDIWLVDATPRAIQCRSADPIQTVTYEIQA